jgi:hypothetical protein
VSWLQTADGIAPAHALEINTAQHPRPDPGHAGRGWLSDRVDGG